MTSHQSRSKNRRVWLRLSLPIAVLCLEVALLSSRVEFHAERMAWVANPLLFTGGMVGAVVFLLLAAETLTSVHLQPLRRRVPAVAFWTASHILLYVLFAWQTHELASRAPRANVTGAEPVVWTLLAAAVAMSACLAVFPSRPLARMAWERRREGFAAFAVGAGTSLLIPVTRRAWRYVAGPTIGLAGRLIDLFPGRAVIGKTDEGVPILGTHDSALIVTWQCSEMESLLIFFALLGTVLTRHRKRLRLGRFACVAAIGFCSLCLLNSLRLYLLVLLGWRFSLDVSVGFAHSRISSLVFLGASLVILWLGFRWSQNSGTNRQED